MLRFLEFEHQRLVRKAKELGAWYIQLEAIVVETDSSSATDLARNRHDMDALEQKLGGLEEPRMRWVGIVLQDSVSGKADWSGEIDSLEQEVKAMKQQRYDCTSMFEMLQTAAERGPGSAASTPVSQRSIDSMAYGATAYSARGSPVSQAGSMRDSSPVADPMRRSLSPSLDTRGSTTRHGPSS